MAEYERRTSSSRHRVKILAGRKTLRLYDNCRKTIPYYASALSRLIDCHPCPRPRPPLPPPPNRARFEGTDRYVATDDLKLAVNAALTLQRPL